MQPIFICFAAPGFARFLPGSTRFHALEANKVRARGPGGGSGEMPALAAKMREILNAADPGRDLIDGLPLGTTHAQNRHGLIDPEWDRSPQATTACGMFPSINQEKLSVEGIQVGRTADERSAGL